MNNNFIKFLCFFIVLLFILGCSQFSFDIIATFNGGMVTSKEVIDEFRKLSIEDQSLINDKEEVFKLIRKIALEKILIKKAIEEGIAKSDEIQSLVDKLEKKVAFKILFEKNVKSKVTLQKSDFLKYSKIYEVYQIVKRKDILEEKTVEKSLSLLKSLSQNISSLEEFKESAKKYSDDITASEGGYIGKIRLGIMDEKIDQAILKTAKGKISNIIETDMSFHLVFVNSIESISDKNILQDTSLKELVIKEKQDKIEEIWYQSLLKDSNLKIFHDKLSERIYDQEVVIQYKNRIITRKEIFNIMDSYKNDNFPEPNNEELTRFLNDKGLNLIIDYLCNQDNIRKSSQFKNNLKEEINFILSREYIRLKTINTVISNSDVINFYNKNKKSLFTFKLDNGKIYTQPINEVVDFIKQKIQKEKEQENRYLLYKKVIEEENFQIFEKKLENLSKRIIKS